MYKPKLSDVQVSKWSTPIAEDPNKQFAQVVIYLNGGAADAKPNDGKNYDFGYYIPVEVSVDASEDMKREAISFAATHLLEEFDVVETARKHHYDGDLEYLRPLRLVDMNYVEAK